MAKTLPTAEDIYGFDTVPIEIGVMDLGVLIKAFEKAGYDITKKDSELKPSEKHMRPRLLSIALAAEELFQARSTFGAKLNNFNVLNSR